MIDVNEAVGWTASGGIVAWVVRLAFVQFMKQQPAVETAGAQSDAIKLLREDMARMHQDHLDERKQIEEDRDAARLECETMKEKLSVMQKQLMCLEMLLARNGIDVHAEYKLRGIEL